MESSHPLKALLQTQLASDSYAVLHLPYILSCLTSEYFLPSAHLPKWIARISSLLHSKDPGAQWAGLCLALQTAVFSKSVMLECGQSWLSVALPMISKNEPTACLKASVRLLRHIFVAAKDVPEFQRQLATPNVPKFSLALVVLADRCEDQEMTILALNTLTRLVPLYPTPHRVLQSNLTSLAMRILNGSSQNPISDPLLESASRFYSVMHFTGGKVGASNLWKKSVDEMLISAWNAFLALRSTFPREERYVVPPHPPALTGEPLMSIPLQFDRLRCCVVLLVDLLRSPTRRPVQVPIGPLMNLTTTLLSCTEHGQVQGHVDIAVRAVEISVIPLLWRLGCNMLTCLARCIRHNLTPELSKVISVVTYHLEQKLPAAERLLFLEAVQSVLTYCHPLHSPLPPMRLAKAILPSLTIVLAVHSDPQRASATGDANKNKKGKKRMRRYEGDEVFKLSREVIFHTVEDGKVALAALGALQHVLRNPQLPKEIHSVSSRVLLSILFALPQMLPSSLSPDLTLHGRIFGKVQELCAELGSGTASVLSKSLGLVIKVTATDGSEHALSGGNEAYRKFELLLHPRVPPLVSSLPNVESLSLFRGEESQEEVNARKVLGLHVNDQRAKTPDGQRTEPAADESMDVESAQSVLESNLEVSKAVPIPRAIPELLATVSGESPTTLIRTLPPGELLIPEQRAPLKATALLKTELHPTMVGTAMDEDGDEDEDVPVINMDSDSD